MAAQTGHVVHGCTNRVSNRTYCTWLYEQGICTWVLLSKIQVQSSTAMGIKTQEQPGTEHNTSTVHQICGLTQMEFCFSTIHFGNAIPT